MYLLDETFLTDLEKCEGFQCPDIENKEVLDKILFSEHPEEIPFEDFDVFFQNIDEFAQVVHMNNDYFGKLFERVEKLKGVPRARRVL